MMQKEEIKVGSAKIRFVVISFCLLQISLFSSAYGQAFSVSGKVTAARFPVKDVSVTFINNADTTVQFWALTDMSGNYQLDVITSVESNINNIPEKFELAQSYPNPFSSSTAIQYYLKKPVDVQITIYDILGREVRKFVAGNQKAGAHDVLWDGRNNFGKRVANGVYFYRVQAGEESQVKKMILTSNGTGSVSLPQASSSKMTNKRSSFGEKVQTEKYTIRVDNTEKTFPLIVSVEIGNVTIKKDTTINFSVSRITSAVVNLDSSRQYIRGFGAANILQWRPDMTADQVQKAYGTGDGEIGLSILRLRVPYELNENSLSIQVPTATLAQSLGAIVFASPWTPPAIMKTNNNIVGGELRESSYQDYADHLKTFADYMADNGVPLYGISLQNEPDITVTYESCDWSPSQMVKFMRENASSIGTRIIAPESFQFLRPISDAILNDSLAAENLDIVGGHIYGGGIARYPLAEEKGKEIWMTEHLELDTTWTANLATGVEISNCMNVGMSAYVWWYLVRYYGLIYDNLAHKPEGTVSKRGYVVSQFARFVRPGFYRVECEVAPSSRELFITAYKDGSSSKVVIVAVNTSSTPLEVAFRLQSGSTNSFTTYRTTESENCVQGDTVNLNDNGFSFTIKESSIITFVSEE